MAQRGPPVGEPLATCPEVAEAVAMAQPANGQTSQVSTAKDKAVDAPVRLTVVVEEVAAVVMLMMEMRPAILILRPTLILTAP